MPKKVNQQRRKTTDALMRHVWSPRTDTGTRLIAVDPGDRWTGVAFFASDGNGKWYCSDAQEFDPPEFEDALAETLMLDRSTPPPEMFVYEKWRLYGDMAQQQTGSEFLASQHIGVMKYLLRVHNDHADRHDVADNLGKIMTCELDGKPCAKPEERPRTVAVVKQGAEIKKPTTGILRKKGIKSVARPIAKAEYSGRDHVVDAELHGWHHILRTLKEEAAS